ncbi:MAG: L-aspartate oxidase [Planctomycetes bacterium]|nr:L-aspartate oxidase [Planctomycetota bacterium]
MFEAIDHRRYLIPFRSALLPQVFTDTLVIGSGAAGLRAAAAAAEGGEVIVLAKGALDMSSTAWAQGGIAAACGPDDTVDLHFEDTIRAGAGLCAPEAVRVLVDEAPGIIDELIAHGMRFDRDETGRPALGREGAHSVNRVHHTDGAATGRELVRCLANWVAGLDVVRVFDGCFALDLLTIGAGRDRVDGRVAGAITFHEQFGLQIVWARTTILACGGAGQVYRETTNPKTATGDGLAMAYRAGAELADLEFMQFHPTTLYVAGAERALISEAVRGEGAHLLDHEGVRFMPEYHELGELAPRDVVSRAMEDRLAATDAPSVFLDVRHLGERFAKRFPTLAAELALFDIEPARDLIPVRPSAHYTIGGAWTDLEGRTTMPGLLATGETACLGLHGANRLASNSLLDTLVFGRRAGRLAASVAGPPVAPARIVSDIDTTSRAELDLDDVRSSLRSVMWRNVGIRRDGTKLGDVEEMFEFWARYTMDKIFDEIAGWELQNLLTVGAILTRAARARCESRGTHERSDHPGPAAEPPAHVGWRRGCGQPILHPADIGVKTGEEQPA